MKRERDGHILKSRFKKSKIILMQSSLNVIDAIAYTMMRDRHKYNYYLQSI